MLYMIEFEKPLGTSGRGQARYYLGYCEDGRLDERLEEHRTGRGAAITRAAVERNIQLTVIATHPGTRRDERRWKSWKNHKQVVARWNRGHTND